MSGEIQFYLVAVSAVTLFGLSKGGFSGLGTLGVPMLSLVASPVRAAAIVLPILLVQDWRSVWAFRRDYSLRNLVILTPSAMIGVGVGWAARPSRSRASRTGSCGVRLPASRASSAIPVRRLSRSMSCPST